MIEHEKKNQAATSHLLDRLRTLHSTIEFSCSEPRPNVAVDGRADLQ